MPTIKSLILTLFLSYVSAFDTPDTGFSASHEAAVAYVQVLELPFPDGISVVAEDTQVPALIRNSEPPLWFYFSVYGIVDFSTYISRAPPLFAVVSV